VTQKLPQKFKIVEKYTDMTIHWKALEEHFLMVPLVSIRSLSGGKCIFHIFIKKIQSLKT
jgi:hypothetical protein